MKREDQKEPQREAPEKLQLIARLSTDFFLRSVLLFIDTNDFVPSIVYLTVGVGNVAHLDRDPEESARYSEYEDPVPYSKFRPVSVLYVSTALGIPYETARRHVGPMIKRGYSVREARGVVTTHQSDITPATHKRQHRNAGNVRVFYRRLKAAGFQFDVGSGGGMSTRWRRIRVRGRLGSLSG